MSKNFHPANRREWSEGLMSEGLKVINRPLDLET